MRLPPGLSGPDLSWPRRSTMVLLVVFLAVFMLYLWVRPAPPVNPGRSPAQPTYQSSNAGTPPPTMPRTRTGAPTPSTQLPTSGLSLTTSIPGGPPLAPSPSTSSVAPTTTDTTSPPLPKTTSAGPTSP